MNVRFSAEADADLQAIGAYIADHNQTRALTFTRELAQAAIAIGDTPFAHPSLRGLGHHAVRRKVHGQYLIIYRVTEANIEIVRILHGARDFVRLLQDESP